MPNTIYNMTQVGIYGEQNEIAWEYADSLAAGGNGKTIMIPDGVDVVSCTVVPAGGASAKVQATTDPVNTVINGSPTWVDWSAGASASTVQASCYPPTAIRLVQVGAGTSALSVRAQ